MNCRGFERVLERLLAGALSVAEAGAAEHHLGGCRRCSELLALARIAARTGDPATVPPPELVAEVLLRTAGPACRPVERELCDYVDGALPDARTELVEGHLAECSACRELTATLSALATDLPSLADIRPDARFVHEVLAATLPWRVRAARWWRGAWPRWVKRPRFAAEAAYVSTLIVVLIVSTPGSPLAAMPKRAVELARRTVPAEPVAGPWEQLESAVAGRLESLKSSEATRAVVDSWSATARFGSTTLDRALQAGDDAYGWATGNLRTFREWFASVLENEDSDEETK